MLPSPLHCVLLLFLLYLQDLNEVYKLEPCLHALAQQDNLVHCMSFKPCSTEQPANNHACFSDKQGYQQSYDAALVGADRSKDIVVLRLLNLQV